MASLLFLLLALLQPATDTSADALPPARRIIANAPSNVEVVCALGATDRLVGVSAYATYPPTIKDLPKVGGLDDPDLERIVALKPDLLLQRGHNPHVTELCARHGIRLYVDRTDSLATLYGTIADIGGMIGREEAAQELATSIREHLERVAREAPPRRPRVLLALRSRDRLTPLTTVGKPSYLHEVIEIAGGTNVFGDMEVPYPEITLEDVIARAPDIIIEAQPGAELTPDEAERLTAQWAELRSVPAVRNSAIHVLTEDYVLTPSPRVVLLADRLHGLFTSEATERAE